MLSCASVYWCLVVTCWEKGWPLGSRLWCLIVSLLLSHWNPGSVRCGTWLYRFLIFVLFLTLDKYRPRSKTPFKWRFAGGSMVAHFYMFTGQAETLTNPSLPVLVLVFPPQYVFLQSPPQICTPHCHRELEMWNWPPQDYPPRYYTVGMIWRQPQILIFGFLR